MLVPYKTIYAPVVSYDTLRTYLSIATATDIPSSAEHTSSAGGVLYYTREASYIIRGRRPYNLYAGGVPIRGRRPYTHVGGVPVRGTRDNPRLAHVHGPTTRRYNRVGTTASVQPRRAIQ
jgi:hypothetical protein